jgi:hypothetical protein
MASLPPTTVQGAQESNPAKKYTSYDTFLVENWRYRRPNFPFFVPELSAYGIVLQNERFINQQIYYDSSGEVVQENFPEETSAGIRRMLAYYNKIVDATNEEILNPQTVLQDIYVQPGPNLYYLTIDAATFDSIPDRGNYVLTPMSERTSINKLAEDYREYFRVTDKTSKGHRARIAEILRINNVNILEPDIDNVKEWMGRLNYGTSTPPKKDVRLNPGAELYLPRAEPDFDKVINGGQIFSLEIGSIRQKIASLTVLLTKFKEDIRISEKAVEVLDISKQIALLQQFFPKIVTHFQSNNYKINDFLDDDEQLRIGISEDYELVYVALWADGSLAYLNKALPGLIVDSPFDDPRTMNLLLNLEEISLYNASTFDWQDFVEDYVFPPVTIRTRTADDSLADFTDTSKTIMEQLADRFDKFPVKSEKILGEENEILESPRLLLKMAEQNASIVRNTGDAVVSNLVDISARLENPGATACGAAATVFSEVLNKIDYKQLAAAALDCLKEQIPFDCNDVILAVAKLPTVQMGAFGLSAETLSGLEAVDFTFKTRMNPEQKELASEALAVAKSTNFLLYEEKYEFPLYQQLEEDYAEAEPGEIYLAALELAYIQAGFDYGSVFQEVCGLLSNPIDLIPQEVFNVPTFFFPKVPTVDIDAGFFSSVESAILDMISAIIVQMTKGLIDSILNNCMDQQQLEDSSADANNPNLTDLTSAIANSVGDDNLAETLEELLRALGYGDLESDPFEDPEDQEGTTLDFEDEDTITVEVTTAVQAMKDFFNVLSEQMQDSMKVISLLEGYAPGNLLAEVLTIISTGNFTYGLNNEKNLNEIIVNEQDVIWMFKKIAKLVNIQPIIASLNAAVGKVGCDNINDFISKRIALWCENIPKEQITTYASNLLSSSIDGPNWPIPPILSPFETPPLTCQDNFGGSVAKDPASFTHMLGEVLDRFFEPVYMAYDASALTLPDPYYSDVERKKIIDRTLETTAGLTVDYFNFAKLQEEKIEITPRESFNVLGVEPPGDIEATVMNPEFQRLLATGYIPENGVVDGVYGPYTTAVPKSKAEGFFGLTPQNLSLDAVTYMEKKSEFAPRSRNMFENLDERIKTFDATYPGTDRYALVFESTEPTDPSDKTRLSLNALKLEMFDDNSWRLNVGETLPNVSEFAPFSPAAVAAGSAPETFEIAGNSYSSEAVYNFEYTGESKFPESATDILEYLESRTSTPLDDDIPQVKILSRFISNIISNGTRNDQLTQEQKDAIQKISKENIFADCFKQMTFGTARHCLNSPMFRFSDNNGASYMSLVDWAPLPDEDEAACGYDPHILSLDTMKRRIIEDYEEKIECEDLANEINQDGLGKNTKTSLEKAMMSGIVMTTLRAYALEQLMKAIFPVSAFPCTSFLTPITIKFITRKIVESLKDTGGDYFEAFLEEVGNVFADRMGQYSPYGTIPDVINSGAELGIEWFCADAAIREFLVHSPIEDGAVTLPSGERVEISSITATAISEQFESFPQPENLPGGGSSIGFGNQETNSGDLPEWETCTVTMNGIGMDGYRRYGSDDPCILGTPPETVSLPTAEAPAGGRGTGGPQSPSVTPPEESGGTSFGDSGLGSFAGTGGESADIAEPPATVNEGVPTLAESLQDLWVPPNAENTGPLAELECPENVNSVKIDKVPLEEIMEARLCFLIEEQLYSVIDKLQDLVSFNGEFSFDDRFISKNMPFLDVKKSGNPVTDGSRFSAKNGDKVLSLAQAQVDSVYDVYIEKYNEWHTANGNWALAVAAAPVTIVALGGTGAIIGALVGVYVAGWGALVGAIIGAAIGVAIGALITALGGPVLIGLSLGVLPIPVPRYLFPEELEENPNANIFYTSKENQQYLYTNTDMGEMMTKFISSFAEFIGEAFKAFLKQFEPDSPEDFTPSDIAEHLRTATNFATATIGEATADANDALGAVLSGDASAAAEATADFFGFTDGEDEEDEVLEDATDELTLGETELDFIFKTFAVSTGVVFNSATAVLAPILASMFEVTWNKEYFKVQLNNANLSEHNWMLADGTLLTEEKPKVRHVLADPSVLTNQITLAFDNQSIMHALGAAALDGFEGSSIVPFPKLEDFAGDLTIPQEGLLPRDDLADTFLVSEEEGRGQLIVERYIKTKGRLPGEPPQLFGQSATDDFNGERFKKEEEQFDMRGAAASGEIPSLVQVLSPRETINTSNRNCFQNDNSDLHLPIGATAATDIALGGELNTGDEMVWNIDEFQEYLEDNNLGLDHMAFDEVSFGMRLVYFAPPFSLTNTVIAHQTDLETQKKRLLPGSTQEFIFDEDVVNRSKTYLELEQFDLRSTGNLLKNATNDNLVDKGTGPIAGPILSSPTTIQTHKRHLHLLPLFSAEKRIDSASGIPRGEILDAMNVGDSTGQKSMQKIFSSDYLQFLKNSLKDSGVYKLLFKYCIPGENVLSFTTIMGNLTNELSDSFFDGTKYQLQNLFEITANAGDYTFKTSDEKKKGGNRGEYARALANYGTEGAARNPALFDLAMKTPKIIFKGLAEFIDPVIAPASKMVKAGAAGKIIPQVMKKLNPDGSPGGVEDDNWFLTNFILPKGTVPPPIGDFYGAYPTIVRRTEQGLDIVTRGDAPPIQDNQEIVVYRFRDKLTKASESGNILFDKYMQKVFLVNYNPSTNSPQQVYTAYAAEDASTDINFDGIQPKQKYFQDFALASINRNFPGMGAPLIQAYIEDLEIVRKGILIEIPEATDYLPDFSPFTFKRLKQLSKSSEQIKCIREGILNIIKGQRAVNPENFFSVGRTLATGFLGAYNPASGQIETVSGEGRVIDWIIWGTPSDNFLMPQIPNPEVIFPGYPIPLPVTAIAMTSLPCDVFPYSPSPPHSPLGHIYHAIAAADNLQSSNMDLKKLQRTKEGLENKKKIGEKLCIDMERLSLEEKRRRGLE